MKKFISILLVMILAMGMISFASAESIDDYPEDPNNDYSLELSSIDGEPLLGRWTYTGSTSQGCTVNSSGRLTGSMTVTGNSNVTKIVAYMYPQKLVNGAWTNLATYTDTEYDRDLWAEHYYSTCPKGYYYRIRTSYYVYVGNSYEHINAYSGNYYH